VSPNSAAEGAVASFVQVIRQGRPPVQLVVAIGAVGKMAACEGEKREARMNNVEAI